VSTGSQNEIFTFCVENTVAWWQTEQLYRCNQLWLS
jgi:hypothetical protein